MALAGGPPQRDAETVLQKLIRHLLPGSCLLCDSTLPAATEPDLCRFCLEDLPWNGPACLRCAHPLEPDESPPADGGGAVCGRCRQQPPPFTRAVAPLLYDGFPRLWIGRLKDHLGMVEGRVLGTLLADAAEQAYGRFGGSLSRPELLIPVPLTLRRLARRGHNQALTLARPVASRLEIPVARLVAERRHPGRRQRGASRLQRLENPAGTFACRRRWSDGPCIALVDDVMTTGATASELTRVLLEAGAREVHVLCAARTPLVGRARGTISASTSI